MGLGQTTQALKQTCAQLTMREISLILGSLLKVLLFALVLFVETGDAHKNVLFFLVDDGGFESPVFGNKVIQTPNIKKLAMQGTVFERAYTVVSSCSPSRSAILSGLPTHQNGMYGLHQFPGNFQSNADVTSLPNLLDEAGYKTGIIGKYHVGPIPNFQFKHGMTAGECWAGALGNPNNFGFNNSGCHANYNLVTRNLTHMKLNARKFLRQDKGKPFFLYIGFGDTHRCKGHSNVGSFCQFYGSGKNGNPKIPDWPNPRWYDPKDVIVPPFLPDNAAVREDIAAQYTAWDRLDTGIGVIMNELEEEGVLNETLILFFSDNGIPFPSGKTNLFEQGQADPLIISTPAQRDGRVESGRHSQKVVSSLDLMPTILEFTGLRYPQNATAGRHPAHLTGSSLLSILSYDDPTWRNTAFGSHQFHSLYAYYPMRSMVTTKFRLIHNLNYNLRFAILEDVFNTPTWAEIERLGEAGKNTGWVYNYSEYMKRPEWQLFDIEKDPLGLHNLAYEKEYGNVFSSMVNSLRAWRQETVDPWMPCNPAASGSTWADTHSEICSF